MMETPGQIACYIDLISPYCYLAFTQLPSLARRVGMPIAYHPVHIATAKIAAGNYGPSNLEVPAKGAALKQDIERWARRYGVPLRFPRGFDGERWNAGILFAARQGKTESYLKQAFAYLWAEGGDPANTQSLVEVTKASGLDVEPFVAFVDSSEGRCEFRRACVEAHRRGVFGAPIFFVGKEVFWGNDRLDFLEEYVKNLAAPNLT